MNNFCGPTMLAAAASYITYRFTLKSKKHEWIWQDKIKAFKELQERLTSFQVYCYSVLEEYQVSSGKFQKKLEAEVHNHNIIGAINNLYFFYQKPFEETRAVEIALYPLCLNEKEFEPGQDLKKEDLKFITDRINAALEDTNNCLRRVNIEMSRFIRKSA